MVRKEIWMLCLITLGFLGCDKVGRGGTTEVCFVTQHHEEIIPNIKIYVKYRTDEFPGYDSDLSFDAIWESDSRGQICVQGLPLGPTQVDLARQGIEVGTGGGRGRG